MYKTTARHSKRSQSDYDVYGDLAKIKDALAEATLGMKGRAGEVISQSLDDVREKSEKIRDDVGSFVADKPLKTIGVALLAGVCLGYFLHK